MADKPCELQLYRVSYSLMDKTMRLDTNLAIPGDNQGSMDEAAELAEALRIKLNTDTGEDYHLRFYECIGVVYIWCKDK